MSSNHDWMATACPLELREEDRGWTCLWKKGDKRLELGSMTLFVLHTHRKIMSEKRQYPRSINFQPTLRKLTVIGSLWRVNELSSLTSLFRTLFRAQFRTRSILAATLSHSKQKHFAITGNYNNFPWRVQPLGLSCDFRKSRLSTLRGGHNRHLTLQHLFVIVISPL